MAHIPDGVLSVPVLATGAVLSFSLLAVAVNKLDNDKIPPAAVLAAAFFVASLVSVPAGPSSVHLILNGVMGVLLGWAAIPAVLVALLMQSMFFGHGGLLTLGVNTFNIAFPALMIGLMLKPIIVNAAPKRVMIVGGAAGGLSVLMTAGLIYLSLLLTGDEYQLSGNVLAVTYLPLILVETVISAVILSFLMKVSPTFIR